MDIRRMAKLSVMITSLKMAAEELTETWNTHADGCKYIGPDLQDDSVRHCSNSNPSYDPVCMHDNCPLFG